MKGNLAIVMVILTVGVLVIGLLNHGQVLAQKHYNRGFEAGEKVGFEGGVTQIWKELGMNWVLSYERFIDFVREYGSIHNTPWNEFVIEEKASIAMYGGSGSKLEPEEAAEWTEKYGGKE